MSSRNKFERNGPETKAATRILCVAREHLFERGYSRLTMDELAADLGMSKKTLYQHYPGKEQLVRRILEAFGQEVRADADGILEDAGLSFGRKLRGVMKGILGRLSQINPHLLRDLQRFAPDLHELTCGIRRRNIPSIFGRLLAEGQRRGMVRLDVDPGFAAEFLLQAMQGLLQPSSLEHLRLGPQAVFERSMNLLFGGLLTPAGRNDYEKILDR